MNNVDQISKVPSQVERALSCSESAAAELRTALRRANRFLDEILFSSRRYPSWVSQERDSLFVFGMSGDLARLNDAADSFSDILLEAKR